MQLANYLSSKHPNIKFTFEVENDYSLPFLDVNVFRDPNRFSSTVHRKDTFSGVFTNYKAFLPDTYKKGLISTLLYRAYMINSSYLSLSEEVEKLKQIFKKNGYPLNFIDRCISKFFNKLHQEKVPVHTVPKKELFIILPFLGSSSWNVKNELVKSFKNILPFCKVKIVFKTTNRLATYFNFKGRLPQSLLSGVIYQFTCATCKCSYVGCTKRFWEKRLEEHLHISALTGNPLNGLQTFAPLHHVKSSGCGEISNISRDDFKIIGREQHPYLLQVKESVFIHKLSPELNGNITSVPLHLFTS